MIYRVILMPPAERQLVETYDWLAERSRAGANAWFNRFIAALETLETQPLLCAVAPENSGTVREVRQLLFRTRKGRRYRVLFTVDQADVVILQIRGPGEPLVGAEDLDL